MSGVTQHLSLTELVQSLDQVLSEVIRATSDLGPAMAVIGSYLEDTTIERFETGIAPDGQPWLPSQRALLKAGKTLVQSGRLRDSITHAAGPNWAEVGTNYVSAGVHQFGATIEPVSAAALVFKAASGKLVAVQSVEIPARPFLGVSDDDEASIVDILTDYFDGAFGGR